MSENIENKIAVVTGGTKGIGRAIAESLLRAGAAVFICARDKYELKRALEQLSALGKVDGEICDVRSETQVGMMFEECKRVFGGVDILINNAGIGIIGKTVEEMSPEDFEQTLQTNLFGVFYACHHAIPLLKQRGGGYIINISSLAGQNAHPKMAAYNASKFGLNGFTEALMQEVRADNIKVTAICPGSVNTYFGGDKPSDEKAWQIQPSDIAQIVVDLLNFNQRALPSKIEVRPSNPPKK
ncbi:MAG: SDR family oxidoreductase [Pyrinomonadaceae bacterium]|nr:SDR family oxidoreductase [Pyrinomonadaceae bacterium]